MAMLLLSLLLLILGCSSADSFPGPVDAGGETSCTLNGASACNRYLTAWCQRMTTCCTPDVNACKASCNNLIAGSETNYNTCNLDACRAYAIRTGFDCSSAQYAERSASCELTDKCISDMPLMACSDLLGGTSTLPASCLSWQKQF